MKENHYSIVVTDMERRIIIKALTLLKDKQIHDNKKFDFIDDLIVRSCDAPLINKKKIGRASCRERVYATV